MSWKKTSPKSEKLKFIGDWLKDEFTFSSLCSRYGISRKTGYKLIARYQYEGERAIEEKSHTRHHHPNETDGLTKKKIIELKIRFPNWGPFKLHDWLLMTEPNHKWPAISTIGDLLKKHGFVKPRKYRKRVPAYLSPFVNCNEPNSVWSTDFKGQFRLGVNGEYCYPLTITDNYSRFLLACEGLRSPNFKASQRCFRKIFEEYGLPDVIKSDNGQPFAGVGIGGLSQLSIWWIKLGIMPERIQPGCPQQNGRHERMHRTLKEAVISPPRKTLKEQQKCFDDFMQEYNYERPHQALNGKRPSDVYRKALRPMPQRELEIEYPDHFEIRKVRTNGEIKWCGKRYYLSGLLTNEPIGLRMIDGDRALIYFSKLKLGIIDARTAKIIRP